MNPVSEYLVEDVRCPQKPRNKLFFKRFLYLKRLKCGKHHVKKILLECRSTIYKGKKMLMSSSEYNFESRKGIRWNIAPNSKFITWTSTVQFSIRFKNKKIHTQILKLLLYLC